jgi:4-hydroxy-4-methyl-2-oxoglutarate aldolase
VEVLVKTSTLTDQAVATAQIADACMRLSVPFRIAPAGIRPVAPVEGLICGPVVPVRHYGSVDIFLEALEALPAGGIMVIDNGGRVDEACIGDLVVLEVKNAGLQAMVVWGLHRDTSGLLAIGLPVLSCGAFPAGPSRLDARQSAALVSARLGGFEVTRGDTAFVDQDGAVFIESEHVDAVVAAAKTIREREIQQTKAAIEGLSLREQFQFQKYLKQRDAVESYTFRQHISAISKSIEE